NTGIPAAIKPVDSRRAERLLNTSNVGKLDQSAAFTGQKQAGNLVWPLTILRQQAKPDIIILVGFDVPETADFLVAADHEANSRADVLAGDAQRRCTIPVDPDAQLRFIEFKCGVDVDDAADLF